MLEQFRRYSFDRSNRVFSEMKTGIDMGLGAAACEHRRSELSRLFKMDACWNISGPDVDGFIIASIYEARSPARMKGGNINPVPQRNRKSMNAHCNLQYVRI